MTKFITALLTGMLITFIVDFFIFLGIKQNYIDFYEIDLYYNILFADNQNFLIYFSVSIILGFIVIYVANKKLTLISLALVSIIGLSTLIESIGHDVGKMMFMKKNITYKDSKHTFYGDVYYDGRTTIHFYDNELQRMIILQKDLIK
ncbi:MAG: hypothetical protein L3I99_04135 [Sulfurimonas sp.]|nr:hypothetical protein [Sulfurimonas sp.]